MGRFRVVTVAAAVAAFLGATVATGVARAEPRTNACNVEGRWGGIFVGGLPGDQGAVVFDIFNQAPPSPNDDDGSTDFALASQLALGLGNAAAGDKYHFRWTTFLVSNMATAQGHGFLFVLPSSAMFVIAGHGDHPIGGSFKLSGEGDVVCVDREGTAASATFHLAFTNATMSDDGIVGLGRCTPGDPCNPG